MQLMTQVEYARHRGVGKSAVSNWKRDKLLVLAEDPATGKIKVDVERTDAKLNAKIDPMRGRPSNGIVAASEPATEALPLESPAGGTSPTAAAPPTVADERAAQVREDRIGKALKNAQMARELVPLIEAERRVSEVGRAARDRIHAWFRSEAERFAAEKDIRTVMAIGENGIDQVFSELAEAAERGDFAGDEEDLTPEEKAELEALSAEE